MVNALEVLFGKCTIGTPGGGMVVGVGGTTTFTQVDAAPVAFPVNISSKSVPSVGVSVPIVVTFTPIDAVGVIIHSAGTISVKPVGERYPVRTVDAIEPVKAVSLFR